MTMPLPLLKAETAGEQLAEAYLAAAGLQVGDAPALLLVFPPAWNNRYQPLLYGEARHRGYVPVGITDSRILAKISWPGPIVLHAHWFVSSFQGCEDEIAADERLQTLQHDIRALRERTGARLVWTAHNVFPHGHRFPRTFLRLRQWIFETFDAVHVMQADHVPVLEAAFARPAPATFEVPHMLYTGSHPDCISMAAARAHYAIPQDSFVFAYFGSIQSYKNLDHLLEAAARVGERAGRDVCTIIGGLPGDPATVQTLQQKWWSNPRVRLLMRTIPDHEIQYIHRAADAMVLPYGDTLNSGAAFMAASFGQPFLIPKGLSSAPLSELGALLYEPAEDGGLERGMLALIEGARPAVRETARQRHMPQVVSSRFFDALDGLFAA
jgi:glycosyltransferase involved in cell wall biosynthesis